VNKVKKELHRSSQNLEEVMASIEAVEEEDILDEEEAQLPVIIVVSKGIWLETSLYLLKSTVTTTKLRITS